MEEMVERAAEDVRREWSINPVGSPQALARVALEASGLIAERDALRDERDALLEKPISLAKMDSIDDDATDLMIAYYWCEQARIARAENERLRAAVEKARDKFTFYEQLHRLKCTAEGDEKADRNREFADEMSAALQPSDTGETK